MNVRVLVLALIVLAGCAPRGDLARVPAGAEVTTKQPIYFATTRKTDRLPFGSERSPTTIFGMAEVSIPPIHQTGEIEWPRDTPDPAKHFMLARTEAYGGVGELRQNLNRALALRPAGRRDVVIFVHGFNTRFGEGVYRMAQMVHDLELPGVPLHYSWPSAGNPLNYAYDRDSALFARDGLRRLVQEVSKSNAEDVILVAHSLGSLVTMETLRELRVGNQDRVMRRIGGVVLMSPDVDLDVFKSQADAIGELPQPFVIFSSKKDRALRLVERLTGQNNRLGRLTDVAEIAEYDITYIDVTAFSEGGTNHFPEAKSPALIKLLAQLKDFDAALSVDGGRTGLLPGTVLTVQNATNLILAPITPQ